MPDFKDTLKNLPEVDFVNKEEPSIDMLDVSNHKVVKVPLSQSEQAAASGNFAFSKTQRIPVVKPDGEVVHIPYHELGIAKEQGYRLPDTEEYLNYAADKVAGDQELKTFGENALSALTFGGSTLAETKALGVDPQAIAARDIANPVASGLGTTVGVVGPLLTTGGISNVVGAGVKGAAKLGAATEKYIAKEGAKLGIRSAAVNSMLTKIAPRIAGSAIEAVPYTLGATLDEAALGSTDITGENFLATIGTGALIGGGIGGALGALEATIPVVSKAFKPVKDKLASYVDKEKSAVELFGVTPNAAYKVEETRPGFWKQSVKDLNEMGLKVSDSTEDLAHKLAIEKEAIGKRIGEIYEASPSVEAASMYNKLADVSDSNAESLLVKGQVDPKFKNEYQRLKSLANDYRDNANKFQTSGEKLTSQEIRDLRAKIDPTINWNNPEPKIIQQNDKDLRNAFKTVLGESADKVNPAVGKELRDLSEKYSRYIKYTDLLDKKLIKEGGISFSDMLLGGAFYAANPDDPTAAFSMAALAKYARSDVRRKMVVLGKLEAANLAVNKTVNGAINSFFKPVANLTVPVTSALTSYDLARNSEGKKPKDKVAAFRNIRDNLVAFQTNPDQASNKANRRTMPIYTHAPDTAGFIEAKALTGLSFLAAKLPKRASAAGSITLFKDDYVPSTMELAKYERYVKAVERPLDTIKELERGTLTREHVEALKAVYPNIYKQLQLEAVDKIQKNPEKITYNKRIQLGILLDLPTDTSLIPENVMALQANFQTEPSQGVGQGPPNQQVPVSRADKLDFASRAENISEKVNNSES